MKFNPDELEETTPMQPGIMNYEIVEAKERQSKSGNDMIELGIKIMDDDGRNLTIKDFLVGTTSSLWKIHQFCQSNNLDFNGGVLNPNDIVGQTGQCETTQETIEDGRQMLKIKKYIRQDKQQSLSSPAQEEVPFDDDIPFN